ncbi:MAG TPA: FBP domain-containing protein [Jatrophihabitans sp.]|nr:FBP domain-containing protein [Jatrophihabitans sp.]
MHPVTEGDLRSCFVNCSQGEAKRMPVPRDLAEQPWDELDFFGWTDRAMPGRGYLAMPRNEELIGIALRFEPAASRQTQMCSICLTTHSRGGVALMSARKAGESGRRGNTVGVYMCADLACPLYVRGRKRPAMGVQHREDLSSEDKAARLRTNLDGFVAKLYR